MHENTYSDHRSDGRDYCILRLELVAIAKLRTRALMYLTRIDPLLGSTLYSADAKPN